MKRQLMLVVLWLWIVTSSQEGNTMTSIHDLYKEFHTSLILCMLYLIGQVTSSSLFDVSSTTTTQCSKSIRLQPGNIHRMMMKCEDQENINEDYEDDERTPNCMISYSDDEYNATGWESCETLHMNCGCDECPSKIEATPDVQPQLNSGNNSTIVVALGALVGLLLVLLAVVITGWVWTCWSVRERRNPDQTR